MKRFRVQAKLRVVERPIMVSDHDDAREAFVAAQNYLRESEFNKAIIYDLEDGFAIELDAFAAKHKLK
jgi:hypothetical protein